jgi:hypothetical protein
MHDSPRQVMDPGANPQTARGPSVVPQRAAEAAEAPPPEVHEARRDDEALLQIVASKILLARLRNLHQLLMPFTVDLQKLEPVVLQAVLDGMVTAARADGAGEGEDRRRVEAVLDHLHASDEHRSDAERAMRAPRPLADVLADIPDVQTGAILYAVSVLAIDARVAVNRQYLRYLAARLDLPPQLTTSIEQRFAIAR